METAIMGLGLRVWREGMEKKMETTVPGLGFRV